MTKDDEDNSSADDSALRDQLNNSGFKPDASGVKWMAVQPKILVAGAYKVIRTAAERARQIASRGR